jgi:hypothetical protein
MPGLWRTRRIAPERDSLEGAFACGTSWRTVDGPVAVTARSLRGGPSGLLFFLGPTVEERAYRSLRGRSRARRTRIGGLGGLQKCFRSVGSSVERHAG